MSKVRDNLPLAFMGIAFVTLAAATQCTSSNGDTTTNEEVGQPGTDDSGTPLRCSQDSDCPLPPSTCEGDTTLVYYTDAKCVLRQCRWQLARRQCGAFLNAICFSGGCSSTTTAGPLGGYGGQGGDTSVDAETDGVQDARDDTTTDHAVVPVPDAGSCTEGDDASSCVVPASVCVDQRWMAFFTNGSCQENRCQWQVNYRDCGAPGCQGEGCVLNVTAK